MHCRAGFMDLVSPVMMNHRTRLTHHLHNPLWGLFFFKVSIILFPFYFLLLIAKIFL